MADIPVSFGLIRLQCLILLEGCSRIIYFLLILSDKLSFLLLFFIQITHFLLVVASTFNKFCTPSSNLLLYIWFGVNLAIQYVLEYTKKHCRIKTESVQIIDYNFIIFQGKRLVKADNTNDLRNQPICNYSSIWRWRRIWNRDHPCPNYRIHDRLDADNYTFICFDRFYFFAV